MYLIDAGFAREDQAQVQEGWEVVKLMVGRIRGMVLDILYQAKEREVVRTAVDLAAFGEEVAGVIAPKMKRHGIRFEQEFAPGLGRFELDAGQIQAALVNILENAVDACLEDRQKSEHRVAFRIRRESQQVVFEVEDNGIGMDAETRAGIFTSSLPPKPTKGPAWGFLWPLKSSASTGVRSRWPPNRGKAPVSRCVCPPSAADRERPPKRAPGIRRLERRQAASFSLNPGVSARLNPSPSADSERPMARPSSWGR